VFPIGGRIFQGTASANYARNNIDESITTTSTVNQTQKVAARQKISFSERSKMKTREECSSSDKAASMTQA
jgi:hypothetical protein